MICGWNFATSIFYLSILCHFSILSFDILSSRYLFFSIFCPLDNLCSLLCHLDILRPIFYHSIFCTGSKSSESKSRCPSICCVVVIWPFHIFRLHILQLRQSAISMFATSIYCFLYFAFDILTFDILLFDILSGSLDCHGKASRGSINSSVQKRTTFGVRITTNSIKIDLKKSHYG